MLSKRCLAFAFVLVLAPAAGYARDNAGPGNGLRFGVQTLESPLTLRDTTRIRVEVEFCTARWCEGYADLAFTFGGGPLGSYTEHYVEGDSPWFEGDFETDLQIYDFRMAARFYPLGFKGLGKEGRLVAHPYLGAGLGYFTFQATWEDRYDAIYEDPYAPNLYDAYSQTDKGRERLADGFFPFFLAGVAIPVSDHGELVVELQHDTHKKDGGHDFSGSAVMVGARFRW